MHASGFPGERIWSVVLLQFASDEMMIDEVGGGGSSATPYLSRPGTGRRPCKLRGREWKGAEGNGPRWHGAAGSQLPWIALAAADGLIWQHTGCACIVLRVCVCVGRGASVRIRKKMVRQIFCSMEYNKSNKLRSQDTQK